MSGADLNLSLELERLTAEAFAPFGRIIEFSPQSKDERFEVVIQEETEPWRIAVFRVGQRTTTRLECHLSSMESFEPMSGVGVLLVAEPQQPHKPRAFLLDAPICLHKGVWHEVITLSAQALYKITENKDVHSVFHLFPSPMGVRICNAAAY